MLELILKDFRLIVYGCSYIFVDYVHKSFEIVMKPTFKHKQVVPFFQLLENK